MDENYPTEYYWAAESPEREEEFVGYLQDKRDDFFNTLRSSTMAKRIARNYKYYHNLYFRSTDSNSDLEMKQFGPDGEYVGLAVNQYRSLIKHLHTLVTQYRPSWDAKAKNTEPASIQQAKIGNNVLEHYMKSEHVEEVLKLAVEHALIFNVGFIWTEWDETKGPDATGNPETGEITPGGDVRYSTPYVYDVVYDLSVRSWRDVKWVYVLRRENKWDLLAKYPDRDEEIRENFALDDTEGRRREGSKSSWSQDFREDQVDVWYFYHKKTLSMPEGRQSVVMGDLLLEDGRMRYRDLPLDRCTAGEYLLNCLGYSPANDLTGLQEAYNAEVGTILTNHKSFGVANIWGGPSGSTVTSKELEGGLNVIFCDEKPEALRLLATPKEILEFPDKLGAWMEQISGINSVARGQPEASLKSGTALALVDSKALQAANYLQGQYYNLLEDVGTKTIRYLSTFAGGQDRIISIAGKFNRQYMSAYSPEKLGSIDKVEVQSGNALTRSLSGRVEIARFLMEGGMLKTPEEFFNVINTGQLDAMMEADTNELALVREESEKILEGERLVASAADNHLLHIREHHSLLGSVAARRDTMLSAGVMGHIKEHMDLLRDPSVQELQMVLGYNVPPIRTMPTTMPPQPGDGAIPKVQSEGGGHIEGQPEAMASQPKPPEPPKIPANL